MFALLQAASYLLLIMYSVNNMVMALGAETLMEVDNMDCNTFATIDSLFTTIREAALLES